MQHLNFLREALLEESKNDLEMVDFLMQDKKMIQDFENDLKQFSDLDIREIVCGFADYAVSDGFILFYGERFEEYEKNLNKKD